MPRQAGLAGRTGLMPRYASFSCRLLSQCQFAVLVGAEGPRAFLDRFVLRDVQATVFATQHVAGTHLLWMLGSFYVRGFKQQSDHHKDQYEGSDQEQDVHGYGDSGLSGV
ncbi:hypothetical protein ECTOBSL9_0387 [Ectothiorhodospira sp. BSL-9]|nr:hypothetical protein ECTOBSL9_0387 [Ectothiorhodospira sp. BSL-9]